MDALRFEVGRSYIIFAREGSGHFRAKCVSRTARTATFEANENGATWYMPTFTLRAGGNNLKLYAGDLPIEVFVSNKGAHSFSRGVCALADTTAD